MLASKAYLCQTRQIDQRQVEDVGRVDLEVDGLAVDAFVAAGYTRRLILDFSLDVAEVCEPPVGNVMELCPLVSASCSRALVCRRNMVFVVRGRDVYELEDQWSSGNDASAAG
jgi:hypothetical protein